MPNQSDLSAWLADAVPAVKTLLDDLSATCVVFTDAPYDGLVGVYARALAEQLNAVFIDPQVPGLRTYDTQHLNPESAIAWSNAFLAELDPVGKRCGAW